MVFITVSAILGIVVPYSSFHWLSLTAVVLLSLVLFHRYTSHFVTVCLFIFLAFIVLFLYTDHQNQTKIPQNTHVMTGLITTQPDINGDKLSTIIKTNYNEKVQLTYYFHSKEEKEKIASKLEIGMTCTLIGTLDEPSVARNPNAFNYKKYLYQQKIHWVFKVEDISVEKCKTVKSESIRLSLEKIRQKGIESILNHFPAEHAGIVQALIYGERKNINEDIINSYQTLGLIHLLAISGLHVSLMTGIFYYLCIRVGITRDTSVNILLFLLPIYMILAGASPSVVRSCVMSLILLVSLKWLGRISLVDIISIACLFMLTVDPYVLFNVGFQLSFIVSFSLILSSKMILNQYKHFLSSLFSVSYLSQICSIPILLYYFFEFSLLSLPLNMIYVPLYSVIILPLTLITLLLIFMFEPFGIFFVKIVSFILGLLNEIAVWISSTSFATVTLGKPHLTVLFLCIVVTISALYFWEVKKSIINWLQLGILCILLFQFVIPYLNPYGAVTMIDVGQGDSILIELPFRKAVYLIDTGGTVNFNEDEWRKRRTEFSTGNDIILPILKSKGIRRLDKLIITHGDMDHIGGAEDLLKYIPIHTVILGKSKKNNELEEELTKLALTKGSKVKTVKKGDHWVNGDYHFSILAPTGEETSENDNSIVLYTKLGGISWLFTGDLEKKGEQRVLSAFQNLKTDVLKIGHHGSKTSSTDRFIEQLKPKVGLISVGENNTFNHPHPDVMERLKENKVKVFRTDLHGAIQYKFIRNRGTFSTILP